ncbi:MAG: D-tyrosyl-tRNA(Tyr) deacylase [Dehalococcoidia bacterium]|nr:MAG: D-tyrosyl-tRNA(Tyr) deacylase [Dehalococcoidia bacterium]
MRALIQRVSQASVSVQGNIVAAIEQGLVALVGVARGDSEADARYLAEKTANLRVFPDESGKFNLSALDISGEVLVVSQFTLVASTRKGRRPSFTEAAPPEEAEPLVDTFAQFLRSAGLKAKTGRFQQHMLVEIHNDGPVTIFIDSDERLKPRH